MAYQKRNFKKDQLLTADELNKMDDQIASNEESAKKANESLKDKFDKSSVVQEKGNSETAVMSQAAATAEFNKLSKEIVEQNSFNLTNPINTTNKTHNGVEFQWDGEWCNIYGTASTTAYCVFFGTADTLPENFKPGKYYVDFECDDEYITGRIFYYTTDSDTYTQISITKSQWIEFPENTVGFTVRFNVGVNRTVNGTARLRILSAKSNEQLGEDVEIITKRLDSLDDITTGIRTNRKLAMFGDSITYGRNGDASGQVENHFGITLAKHLGMSVDNLGVGSSGWIAKGGSDGKNAFEKISSTNITAYDYITLGYGVNDVLAYELGEWNSTDETTIMGQMRKVINYIYEQNPNCVVVVIGAWNGRNVGQFPKYKLGYSKMIAMDTAYKSLCEYYGIPYIQQYDCPLNGFTMNTFMGADGVHPSVLGYQRIGEWLSGKIKALIG